MEPLSLLFCSISIFTLLFFTVKIFSKLFHGPSPSSSLSSWLCSCYSSQHMPSLQGKHVFITGASSGIGLAVAKSSIQQGAFVTMVARRLNKLQEASKKLVEETQCGRDRINVQAADVGDFAAISEAVAASLRWRPIDVLICNAGITHAGYLEHTDVQDVDRVIRTNINGTVYALHQVLPSLKERSMEDNQSHRVSIVIISSLASLFFMYGHAVYTASKYAVRGLAEGMRMELMPYKNIKISVVCPGFVDTSFLDEAGEGDDEITELLKKVNLLSKEGSEVPEHAAKCVLDAVKKGKFLMATQPIGAHLVTLGRGVVPADTLPEFLWDLLFLIPYRFMGLLIDTYNRHFIVKHVHVPYKMQ